MLNAFRTLTSGVSLVLVLLFVLSTATYQSSGGTYWIAIAVVSLLIWSAYAGASLARTRAVSEEPAIAPEPLIINIGPELQARLRYIDQAITDMKTMQRNTCHAIEKLEARGTGTWTLVHTMLSAVQETLNEISATRVVQVEYDASVANGLAAMAQGGIALSNQVTGLIETVAATYPVLGRIEAKVERHDELAFNAQGSVMLGLCEIRELLTADATIHQATASPQSPVAANTVGSGTSLAEPAVASAKPPTQGVTDVSLGDTSAVGTPGVSVEMFDGVLVHSRVEQGKGANSDHQTLTLYYPPMLKEGGMDDDVAFDNFTGTCVVIQFVGSAASNVIVSGWNKGDRTFRRSGLIAES